MMTTRILPKAEWNRLDVIPMPQIAHLVSEDNVRVVAVEKDGELVAAATLYAAPHWEGTWISPNHRTAGTTRALLRGLGEAVGDFGVRWAFVGVDEEKNARMLERMHGQRQEVQTYLVPLRDS